MHSPMETCRDRGSAFPVTLSNFRYNSWTRRKLLDRRSFDEYFPSLKVIEFDFVAYFDPSIDIPHAIMVGHFAVMLSACRSTSHALSLRYLNSKRALQSVTGIWIPDLWFRPITLAFN